MESHDLYVTDVEAMNRVLGLQRPGGRVLLHAMSGFVDAGQAGTMVVDHILSDLTTTRLVTFAADQLVDYRSRRPMMTFRKDQWVDFEQPYLVIDHVLDREGTSFLLLHGTEPDVQWERVIDALCTLVEELGVELTVGTHGIPMAVPHTRPLTVTAHATRTELLGEHHPWFGTVQVPASMSALFEFRLGQRGRDAAGYTVHVPHYLAQSSYPPAAVIALEHVERLTGLDLASGALSQAAREATQEVERQVHESPEIQPVIASLEEQYDQMLRQVEQVSMWEQSKPLPTADELGEEFERFLAEHSGD